MNNFRAQCEQDEQIISGFCELASGEANLFNAAINPGGYYECTWRPIDSRPVQANVFAFCVKFP